jgi:hypothetical protein
MGMAVSYRRICGVLHADFGDVIEYMDEGNEQHDTGGKSAADNSFEEIEKEWFDYGKH